MNEKLPRLSRIVSSPFFFNLKKLLKELGVIVVVEDRTVEVCPTCVRTGEHIFSILNHHVTGAIKKIQFYGLDCP